MTKTKAEEDLSVLSDDELMERWTDLGSEAMAIKDRLSAFSKEHQRREREAQLRKAVGDLSPEDLELLQTMEPTGVESEEQVQNG